MTDKVSIIIPVYNKEKFIKKCINSIENQDYLDWEAIIIDDGSTDRSVKIVENKQKKDSRIKLIRKNHKGVSVARNVGIKLSSGKYLIFVDADDEIKPNYITTLLKYKKYDLVVSNLIINNFQDKYCSRELRIYDLNLIKKKNLFHYIFKKENYPIFSVIYTKLYKTNIIKDNHILFTNQNYGEDSIFVLNYLKNILNIKCISYAGYINNIINGTLSRKYVNDIWEKCLNIVKTADSDFRFHYNSEWQFLYCRSIKLTLANDRKNLFRFIAVCKLIKKDKYYKYLSINKLTSKKDKLYILIFKLSLYKLLYYFYNLRN